MPDDLATVLDIVLACRRVSRFLVGTSELEFLENEEKHWAVASQLLLVGEAVRRLSDSFCDSRPAIPWPQIAGMRNRLIHQYDKINWTLVWRTAKEDIPRLLTELEPLINLSEGDND